MSFLNIWALAIGGLVVPALLILYFLKLRRREETVPSTLLWKRAVQDLQVNAPFQKLRKNLLLLLQMLVLLAGVVALARPIIQSGVSNEKSLILLIDRSASMNTLEPDGRTRLQLAKEQAERLVRTLNRTAGHWLDVSSWFNFGAPRAQTRAMVIAFADRASVVAPFTTNVDELVQLIRGIEPTDGPTNLKEALDLATAYMLPTMSGVLLNNPVSPEVASKLILVSDGGVADLRELVLRSGTMEYVRIGETSDNVGITALRTQRNYERPELVDVFVQIRNYGAAEVQTDVSLYVDSVLDTSRGAVQTITLAAAPQRSTPPATAEPVEGESPTAAGPAAAPVASGAAAADRAGADAASLSYQLTLDRAAMLEIRLARDDALLQDNQAATFVPPPRRLRVLCVHQASSLLPYVLRGLPLAERVFMTPSEYESVPIEQLATGGRSNFDVVIISSHSTKRLPIGNYLFLGGLPELAELKQGDPVENFQLTWWDDTSAVLRNVRLEEVYVRKGLTLRLPEGAEVLIEGPGGPVLARWSKGGSQFLLLNFVIESSTWWRERTFPIFAYNALQYLGSSAGTADAAVVQPGRALRIPLPVGKSSATVRRPDGSSVTISANEAGEAYFAGTQQVGIYTVEPAAPERSRFAVNLEDDWESNIRPQGDLHIGGTAIQERAAIKTATPEIWRWFIGVALLVVFLEWYIYNRRVMI